MSARSRYYKWTRQRGWRTETNQERIARSLARLNRATG